MSDRRKRRNRDATKDGNGKLQEPVPAAPDRPETEAYPDPVDDTLDDSFPASDPPPWWGR